MRFLGHGLLPCGNTPVATAMCSPPPRLGAVARIRLRLVGLLRNAQYAPSCAATRLRSIRRACSGYVLTAPRLGAVARIRLRTSMTCPSSATDLSSKLALFRAFRYNIPDAVRDNRAQRTQFKEAPWDSISIEATRGLNLHYPVRYNMSTNRVSSPT